MNNKTKADKIVEIVKKACPIPIIVDVKVCPNCEDYRKALQDILTHSTSPFVRIDMSENMKWLNYVHDVAKEVLK